MKTILEQAKRTQNFIEENYPNYSSSDEIQRNNQLFMILDGEDIPEYEKFDEEYLNSNFDRFLQFIEIEFMKSQLIILCKAILNSKFEQHTPETFNKTYDTNIIPESNIDHVCNQIEEQGHDYFYVSYDPKDVLNAIEEDKPTADRLDIDLVCINGIYIAIY